MENNVNYLSGKEWLRNAINFWLFDINNLEELYERFKSFCFKKRETGLCCKKMTSDLPEVKKYDFGFFGVSSVNEIKECAFVAASSAYNSYHVFYLRHELMNNQLLPDFVYKLCIGYGMEYRGKVVCWDKKKNVFSYSLIFLNRINSPIMMINDIQPITINAKIEGQYVIESKSKMDDIGLKHPAPYSYIDIQQICNINHIENKVVLDPFLGVGSTIIGCYQKNKCIGIELNRSYVELIFQRYDLLGLPKTIKNNKIICGDSYVEIKNVMNVDVVITSPPYFNILKNNTTGVRSDGSQSRQGVDYYSDNDCDIGNINEYGEYLLALRNIFKECYKKTNINGELYLVISDFTVNKKEKNVHSDMVALMNEIGYEYNGTSYIRQNQKAIFPFGYPYKIVLNHIFQYIIKFSKHE